MVSAVFPTGRISGYQSKWVILLHGSTELALKKVPNSFTIVFGNNMRVGISKKMIGVSQNGNQKRCCYIKRQEKTVEADEAE